IFFNGGRKLTFHKLALAGMPIHILFEKSYSRLFFCFRPVQSNVGFSQNFFGIRAISWNKGEADSCSHAMMIRTNLDRTFETFQNPDRNAGGALCSCEMARNNRELITSQSGEQISIAHCRRKSLGDYEEDFISSWVAIDVIYFLESVQIKRKDRVNALCPRRRSNCLSQCLLKL